MGLSYFPDRHRPTDGPAPSRYDRGHWSEWAGSDSSQTQECRTIDDVSRAEFLLARPVRESKWYENRIGKIFGYAEEHGWFGIANDREIECR